MLTKDEIQQIGDVFDAKLKPIHKKLDILTSGVSRIATAMKSIVTKDVIETAVEKSKMEIMSKMATKQDLEETKAEIKLAIQDIKIDTHKSNKETKIRLKNLEEHTGTTDPTRN